VAEKKEQKILRIGVVHEGRIIEERLLRKPSDVTIGASPKCTFILPIPNLPESYRLLLYKNGKYILRFTAGMVGMISVQDKLVDLKVLKDSQYVQRQGDYYLFPLDENTRGKLVFGEVSLLFQFVVPPPPIPKLELPASAKGGVLARIDAPLFWSILISLVLQAGWIGGVQVWWNTSGKFKQTKAKSYSQAFELLKAEVQKKAPPKPPEQQGKAEAHGPGTAQATSEGQKRSEEQKKKPVAQAPRRPSGEGPVDPEAQYRKRLAVVRSKTVLRFLGGRGPGGEIVGAVVESAAKVKLESIGMQKGGAETAAVGSAPSGFRAGSPLGGAGEGTTYERLRADQIGGGIKTGPVAGGQKQEVADIKIRLGGLGGGAGADEDEKQAVANILKGRQTAYKSCYEQRLRVRPDLQGKVTIEVEISPAGTVANCSVTENATGDEDLVKCICERVRTWRFPAPKSGQATTYSFPMVLQPGG
jgi:TonB family protein